MLNIVILAAGKGTRMNSTRPKVLHKLAGSAMLDRVIKNARGLNAENLFVVVGHEAAQVVSHVGTDNVTFIEQNPQLGTGHALQLAAPFLNDALPTMVLYGDVPLTKLSTLQRLASVAQQGLGLLTVHLENPAGYGRIVRDAQGCVVRNVEQKDATPAQLLIQEVNTGILMAPTAALKGWLQRLSNNNAQQEYYLTDIIAMAAQDGVAINTAHPDDLWETLGVNSKQQLAELEAVHRDMQACSLLNQGVTLSDPSRIDVRGDLICEKDVEIDVGCVFEGNVHLKSGVTIGPYCVIRNAVIDEGVAIAAFSHIDGATIGAGSKVGPFARLRPQTMLAENVHIGNFVEVKKSTVAAGSKINHLSYVGDAQVGSNVNIGAGTITCNYDGVRKHLTTIEDFVFIGSNTQLVAPVTVGAGATVAAGSVITKNVPAGGLSIARGKQVYIEGWKRPE